MAEKLFGAYGQEILSLTLVPGVGGVFEVEVDGSLVFSKKALGRHATFPEVRAAIDALRA